VRVGTAAAVGELPSDRVPAVAFGGFWVSSSTFLFPLAEP
jgi:hypothetical protein